MGLTPFAVVDVETTGFSPRLHDRVLEVAVLRLSPQGEATDSFCTLVNPGRDVGATHVHGITASDVSEAPTFGAISGDVASRLEGAIFVSHNARFDRGFVLSDHADWPGLLEAIAATGASTVWVTHGFTGPLVRWLREQGLDAQAIATRFEGDVDEPVADEQATP